MGLWLKAIGINERLFRAPLAINTFGLGLGLKRKFSFSHFREYFRKNLFSFSQKFLTKIDENSESFRENAKSVIFATYFNFLRIFLSIILF
jgi:hypothetical protein